jgi:hypothetical protein
VKTFVRAGLATLVAVALTLAATAAFAIEYDDVIGLTKQGVSDRTIVELIVKDGRAFEMNEDEIAGLRDEDVSEDVIQAMLDPSYGQDWLDGKITGDDDQYYNDDDSDGYSTSLDRAYGQGYNDGRSTALVYSFGYYYGPLARYYYCDPFYYPFWYSGLYASSYWPSYCAFYYRPAYSWYGAYPYNYYNYDSYYCYTWYDPGYYSYRGYSVRPGGRTIWDNGPRWRDGGLPPSGNGNVNRDPLITRLADHREGRPAAPPIIRDLLTRNSGGGGRDLVSGLRNRDGRVTREVAPVIRPVPGDRTVGDRSGDRIVRSGDRGNGRVIRSSEPVTRPVAPGRIARGDGTMRRGDEAGRMVREGRAPRIAPGRGDVVRRSDGRVPVRRGPDLRGQDRRAPEGRGSSGRRNVDGGRSYDPSRRIERAPETRGESRQAPPARGNYQRPDRGQGRSERAVEAQPERQPEVRNNDGGQRPAEEKKADAPPEQQRGERVTGMLGGRR